MVTAGHCFPDKTTVETWSGKQTVGTVSGRRVHKCIGIGAPAIPGLCGEEKDMELIGGKDYDGKIFAGDRNTSTTIPVAGARAAKNGDIVCYSGMSTGENCGGKVTDVEAQECPQGEPLTPDQFFVHCVSPAIHFEGGTQNTHGDSGAPFYTKDHVGNAIILGHVIRGAQSGSSEGYAEPWTEVSSTYGVHIVTDAMEDQG